jgi:hypothetical protein
MPVQKATMVPRGRESDHVSGTQGRHVCAQLLSGDTRAHHHVMLCCQNSPSVWTRVRWRSRCRTFKVSARHQLLAEVTSLVKCNAMEPFNVHFQGDRLSGSCIASACVTSPRIPPHSGYRSKMRSTMTDAECRTIKYALDDTHGIHGGDRRGLKRGGENRRVCETSTPLARSQM